MQRKLPTMPNTPKTFQQSMCRGDIPQNNKAKDDKPTITINIFFSMAHTEYIACNTYIQYTACGYEF